MTMRHAWLGALALALLLGVAGSPTAGAAAGDGAWYRVQFDGTITGADRTGLDAAGARSPLYVPEDAYVAWLDPSAVEAARGIATVESVRPLERDEKIDGALAGTGPEAARVSALVYAERLDEARTALDAIGDVAAVLPDAATGSSLAEVLVTAAATDLAVLAEVPEVLHVGPAIAGLFPEDEGTAQIVAGNLDLAGAQPVPGYEDWLSGLGLDGSGVKVAIVDTGVDEKHPDLAGRVEKRTDYTPVPEPEDSFGHGTHVSGIVAGNAAALREAGGVTDLAGFLYGLGVAPRAQLLDQNAIGTTVLDWPPPYGFARLTSDALAAGASAWNASWHTGEGTGAGYIATARTLDILVRDGDPGTAVAEPFTMVFSAGNAGPGRGTMTSPKEAKNIISVASTRSHRLSGTIDEVSSFSSRGPARDGRIAPTIAAPGDIVVSTRSLPASAVCNEPPTDGNSLGLYGVCSGTSMAAPHVTGAVALVTQWWRARAGGGSPSPALTKALLVNTATDIGVPDVPNDDEGWGRVNLGALFDPQAKRIYVDQERVFTDPGDRRVFAVKPADPTKPLKVTLVWTDAPGTPQADRSLPALVNDLDLSVEAPKATYRGNSFSGGASVEGGAPDRLNNVESVYVRSPGTKTHRIVVEATNLPGDGVPGAGDTTDQDFALVISNAVPDEIPPPAELGELYAAFTFDDGADGWTTTGVPTWTRSAPGTKTGTDDPSTASYRIEGRTEYIDNLNASLVSPPIATDSGRAVVEAWIKHDIEAGFDLLRLEWSADGTTWNLIESYSGENAGYPAWRPISVAFDSPGGDVRVRFRFTSDITVSALTNASLTGARVDEVVVGKQRQ